MKDKSLEELDILKILIYALSFISVCTALILFLLLPILRDYKHANSKANSQTAVFNVAKNKFNLSEEKISVLRTDNNKSLEQFEQNFKLSDFNAFLKKYFQNIKIQQLSISTKEKYLKNYLNIQATINNPKYFYNFIDALKSYDNLIKIDYPLNLKAGQEGIIISFNVKIYSS